MIELYLDADPPIVKGLTPGQILKVFLPSGRVWHLTRFGAECIARCEGEKA